MTEKEKAAAGFLYAADTDALLVEERRLCKELCYDYNVCRPSDIAARREIIRKIVGKCGERFWIEPPFYCDYGYNITLGDNFYANHGLVVLDGAPVVFGDNVFIAPGCGFFTAGHPLDAETRNAGLEFAFPIRVGNNVWVGGNVSVLPGVTIGDNTVIGAGSVVTKDIPSGVVAAGNPCRVLRAITEADKKKYRLAP